MIPDRYLNDDGKQLFASFKGAELDWAWKAVEELRKRYPHLDQWTTGGAGHAYTDLRFGARKANKSSASAVMFRVGLERSAPSCRLAWWMAREHDEDLLMTPETHPTSAAIAAWLDMMDAIVKPHERRWKAAKGHVPSDYVDSDANAPEAGQSASGASVSTSAAERPSLNTILFGPPGTGKTYATIDETLAILDPAILALLPEPEPAQIAARAERRSKLKARFDELAREQRVRFVTFHQSFSYEDFVEGLRSVAGEDGVLRYEVVDGVFKVLCGSDSASAATAQDSVAPSSFDSPRVLIIDEINRGNVSRIFGELITLIEPSKRAGADEALAVALPYSKQAFSVPSNVYLIGTMNTADRSLTGLDIALRRRFAFKEMPPQPHLLDHVQVEGVNVGQLLRTMNDRIEILLDREHCLGHAYFMPLTKEGAHTLPALARIFRRQVLPLLQEYFFEDWERIGWVLNDPAKKNPNLKFIRQPRSDLQALFGQESAARVQDRRWLLNEDAFNTIDSYRQVLSAPP